MSQIERISSAWDRFEKWSSENAPDIQLGAGATDADIIALETHLGYALTEELKASLMRHNGVENWTRGELLSVDRIKDEWSCWVGLVDDGTFDDCLGEENDCITLCWYDKSWIPVDTDGGGNGACLDLNPGAKGKVGQIIQMERCSGAEGPLFEDFAAYLENTAERLEGGKYKVENGYVEEIF